LPSFANFSDRTIDGLDAVLTELVHFDGSFVRALCRVVDGDFRAFLEAVESVLGAGFAAVDDRLIREVNGVFGAIFGLDDDSPRSRVSLANHAADSSDNIFVGSRRHHTKGGRAQKNKETFGKSSHGTSSKKRT
jgi:hypothetical protein